MQEWLIHLSTSYPYAVYASVVVLACAEGPFLSILFGVLIRLGFFSIIPIYSALMIGDLIGDVLWYYLGRRFGHRFVGRHGHYFGITEDRIAKVTDIFHRHKDTILFMSKITNGLGFALVTLFTAGMVRIPFRRYMSINLIAQFVWTSMLLGTGYFFSHLYTTAEGVLSKMSVIAGAVCIVFIFLGCKNYLQSKIK